MYVLGLAVAPSGYCLHLPSQGSSRAIYGRASAFSRNGLPSRPPLQFEGNNSVRFSNKHSLSQTCLIKCAMDASNGDAMNNQNTDVFPRINIRDPYKRLGLSKEASEGEIQAARNFLMQKYAGHKPSVDAIEESHDKIIMQKFNERKRPKLNIKRKVRDVTQHRYVQAVMNRFRTPADSKLILQTSITFLVLGVLTFLFPTEEGPTLQVAISLVATIYFIYSRLKSKLRATLYGAGGFILAWLVATFLMVSVIPPIFKGPTGFEVTTSLITYMFLWIASTYLN